ncbi:hypothetical protein Tco_0282644 [Tanacetum coccineum]
MAILDNEREVVDLEVSLHEEDVGYKETTKDSQWYLDNGASNHMTGMRDHFENLDEKVSGRVKFGDGSYIEIKGKVGKQSRAPFPKKAKGRSTSPLDLIYGDLCGPITSRATGTGKRLHRGALKSTKNFWAEAVRHAIYILNRRSYKALEDNTPIQKLLKE